MCAVLIVNVKVAAEGGFEVNIDRQLSVALVNHNIVNEQPQVVVADRTVLDDSVKNINMQHSLDTRVLPQEAVCDFRLVISELLSEELLLVV